MKSKQIIIIDDVHIYSQHSFASQEGGLVKIAVRYMPRELSVLSYTNSCMTIVTGRKQKMVIEKVVMETVRDIMLSTSSQG